MRMRLPLVLALTLFASNVFAKDVYLTIGGSVGNFRTDTRVFNPSSQKDITINAAFLEAGSDSGHPNNNGVAGINIVVPKRAMLVYDDVVSSLFGITGKLGAIRFTSADDFVATQKIYAAEAAGTLGQFVPGLDVGQARAKGVVLQLKANGSRGTRGTFRTNVGFVNPVNATTTVNARLYDKNGAQVGAVKTITMQPFGVISPSALTGLFNAGSADLSDAHMIYDATNPIFAYGSVLDNGTEDPTYIPASEDSGTPIVVPPPPAERAVEVTLRNFQIDMGTDTFKVGERIRMTITNANGNHGFALFSPGGVDVAPVGAVRSTVVVTFTVTEAGPYTYFCTESACGVGHGDMNGVVTAVR